MSTHDNAPPPPDWTPTPKPDPFKAAARRVDPIEGGLSILERSLPPLGEN